MSKIQSRFLADMITAWTEFEAYWYRSNQHFADDIDEPSITDFMNWLTENLI